MKDENVVNGKGKIAKKSQKHIRRNGRARGHKREIRTLQRASGHVVCNIGIKQI